AALRAQGAAGAQRIGNRHPDGSRSRHGTLRGGGRCGVERGAGGEQADGEGKGWAHRVSSKRDDGRGKVRSVVRAKESMNIRNERQGGFGAVESTSSSGRARYGASSWSVPAEERSPAEGCPEGLSPGPLSSLGSWSRRRCVGQGDRLAEGGAVAVAARAEGEP